MGNSISSIPIVGDVWDSTGGLVTNTITGAVQTGLDSIGISPHGRDQYFARNLQREMLGKQQDFQAQQNAIGRQHQIDMYNLQRQNMLADYPTLLKYQQDAQFNTWRQQFAMQNQWNSPLNQVRLLNQAGINPNSVFAGQGQVASNQTPQPSSSVAPPVINPTPYANSASPIGLPQGLSGRGIAELGSFVRDLAEARKAGAETSRLEQTLNEYIENLRLDNEAKRMTNDVYRSTKNLKIAQAFADFAHTWSEVSVNNAETALKQKQAFTEAAKKFMYEQQGKLNEKQKEQLQKVIDNYEDDLHKKWSVYDSEVRRNDADATNSRAQAEKAKQEAITESEGREYKITDMENRAKLGMNQVVVSDATVGANIDKIIHDATKMQWESEQAFQKYLQEKFHTSTQGVEEVMKILGTAINIATIKK